MEYRAVGKRCTVVLESLHLPITREETLLILNHKGFVLIEVNIVELARQCLGTSQYRRGARLVEAPSVVDCSSFIKWLYAERGIWLPRRSIQQRGLGEIVGQSDVIAGDIIFISGYIDYYLENPEDGVGHVGIVTGERTVIHAANKKLGVIETFLEKFATETNFRGARRYIPTGVEVITLEVPPNREVEIADDIRWIVLQSL